ncbi:hypothetical protein BGZ76_010607 [Entomortierella beljakovae]|nr:hypothetical protein BGZ76_010607 [Entomortierella beljakovae]
MLDPYAEPEGIFPSSIPSSGPSTQYKDRLKIAVIADSHNNSKLVLGVRGSNYLVNSGFYKGKPVVGPGGFAKKFMVGSTTRIFLRKEKQESGIVAGDILGLAQVRSGFWHKMTFPAVPHSKDLLQRQRCLLQFLHSRSVKYPIAECLGDLQTEQEDKSR